MARDRVQAKMIERYEKAFEQLEVTETEAFGENSYFHWEELGLPMQSDDGMHYLAASFQDVKFVGTIAVPG